mmetsp:Transcript_43122/g.137150  ORF Transcript_43122/g.137150 Transcript_43122/m.137150 type:complete len:209 (-) Transcript_43122:7-633(-)
MANSRPFFAPKVPTNGAPSSKDDRSVKLYSTAFPMLATSTPRVDVATPSGVVTTPWLRAKQRPIHWKFSWSCSGRRAAEPASAPSSACARSLPPARARRRRAPATRAATAATAAAAGATWECSRLVLGGGLVAGLVPLRQPPLAGKRALQSEPCAMNAQRGPTEAAASANVATHVEALRCRAAIHLCGSSGRPMAAKCLGAAAGGNIA